MNCPNVYLATTDESISLQKVRDIGNRNIKLVVFDEVKRTHFSREPSVIGYSFLVQTAIPQWERFW
jgi:hypothetical protein